MYDTSYIDTLLSNVSFNVMKKNIFIITEKTRRKSGNTFLVYLKKISIYGFHIMYFNTNGIRGMQCERI